MHNFSTTYKKLFFFSFLIFVFFVFRLWDYYPIYGGKLFSDWYYIIEYSSCKNLILENDVKLEFNCEANSKNVFIYPSIWLKSYLIPEEIFKIIPYFIIFLFLIVFIRVINNKSLFTNFIILFSTPFVLAMQRGNNEMIIFIIMYFFLFFFQRNKFVLPTIFLFLSGLLKIYPITILPIFLRKKIFSFYNFLLLFLVIAFLIFMKDEIISISSFLQSKITLTYSSQTIFAIIGHLYQLSNNNFIFFSMGAFLILFIISLSIKINIENQFKEENSYILGSTILIFSFFLSSSFEYRLIFSAFLIPLIMIGINKKIFLFKLTYIVLLFSLWFEFVIFYTYNYIEFNYIKSTLGYILNIQTIVLGSLIALKNFFYWMLNFLMIITLKEIIFRKLNF
jgi:hypothetical protein